MDSSIEYKINQPSVSAVIDKLWESLVERDTVVIYHKDCPDGTGAAAIFVLKLQSMGFFEPEDSPVGPEQIDRAGDFWLQYTHPESKQSRTVQFVAREYSEGRALPNYKDKNVIVVDFSLKEEPQTDNFHTVAATAHHVFWFDHHAGAWAQFKQDCQTHGGEPPRFTYCFHGKKAGVMLAWELCYPATPCPQLVAYLQDRDLNTWALPSAYPFLLGFDQHHRTNDIRAYAHTMNLSISAVLSDNPFAADIEQQAFVRNVKEGDAILRARKDLVEQACQRAMPITVLGKKGYIVGMQRVLAHDAAMLLASREDAEFGATFEIESPSRVKVSFRGHNTRTDVNQEVLPLAVALNGGGHPYAAACYMDMAKFTQLLTN